jgi:PhnB protein
MAEHDQTASHGVVPHLALEKAGDAIDFYKSAFAAEEVTRALHDDGQRIMHAHLTINGGPFMLNDIFPEFGMSRTASPNYVMHLHVDDPDAWFNRAVEAGCEIAFPMADQFWGDRYGQVSDPFGVRWSIGAPSKKAD